MTVSATDVRRGPYAANGVTTEFAAPYVLDADDLAVFTLEDEGGEGVGVSSDDYTVEGVGEMGGSTVVFDEAPESGYIVIVRNPARVQPAVFTEGARFPAKTNEKELDRGTMADQHALDALTRTLRAPQYETGTIAALPPRSIRAGNGEGTLLGFDGNGDRTLWTPETPAIIRLGDCMLFSGEFGPCGNGDADQDMTAMAAAVAGTSGTGRKIVTRGGQLIFKPGVTQTGKRWGLEGFPIHRCVTLMSDTAFDLRDTELKVAPNSSIPAFATSTHIANGSTTAFAFSGGYLATTDLYVTTQAEPYEDPGAAFIIQKRLTVDYTATAASLLGGTVNFLVAPAAGTKVTISTRLRQIRMFDGLPDLTADPWNAPALENIAFYDAVFDFGASQFDDDVDLLLPYIYGIGATSIRGFRMEGVQFGNSSRADYGTEQTANRGRGLVLENFADARIDRLKMSGISQGIFVRYGDNVKVDGTRADDVSEAIDFDGPCDNVEITDTFGRDFIGTEQDLIDTGGGVNWTVRGVRARNLGRIIGVYRKPYEWPTFTEFLAANGRGMTQAERADFPETGNILIDDIKGDACGVLDDYADPERVKVYGHGSIMVNDERAADSWTHPNAGAWDNTALDGLPHISNVTVTNVELVDSAMVKICCKNFKGRGWSLIRSVSQNTGDSYRDAAVSFFQPYGTAAGATTEVKWWAEMSGSMEGLFIKDAEGAGVAIHGAQDFTLRTVEIDGFNTIDSDSSRQGLLILRNGGKPGVVRLDGLTIKGGNASDEALIRIGGITETAWATTTAYVRGNNRTNANILYECMVNHTSGTFSTDLAAGKWRKSEPRLEITGRPRLEPTNSAIPLGLSELVGHRVYPMRQYTHAVMDTTSATGSAAVDGAVFDFQGRDKFHPSGFQVIPREAFAGNVTNYMRLTLFKKVGGTTTGLTNLGYVDVGEVASSYGQALSSSGGEINTSQALINEGEELFLRATRQGTGAKFTASFGLVVNGINFMSLST